ncbi:hypothetical protein D3C76_1240320 [compost metagenome]
MCVHAFPSPAFISAWAVSATQCSFVSGGVLSVAINTDLSAGGLGVLLSNQQAANLQKLICLCASKLISCLDGLHLTFRAGCLSL